MDLLQKIRKYENLHIVFWLVKDSCWMLELKWLGAIMMVPTLFLALYLVIKTLPTPDVYISLAIFFWILANSYWMMMEFFWPGFYHGRPVLPEKLQGEAKGGTGAMILSFRYFSVFSDLLPEKPD
jgi:hypothetical protein